MEWTRLMSALEGELSACREAGQYTVEVDPSLLVALGKPVPQRPRSEQESRASIPRQASGSAQEGTNRPAGREPWVEKETEAPVAPVPTMKPGGGEAGDAADAEGATMQVPGDEARLPGGAEVRTEPDRMTGPLTMGSTGPTGPEPEDAPRDEPEAEMRSWYRLRQEIKQCRRCKLCEARNNVVIGQGDQRARVMFIGEGPGQQEDLFGVPFVGRAGELLTKIIQAMGLTRDEVYIGNAVKCRPPNNRQPEQEEMEACFPYLRRQIELIRPEVIVLLGATAWKALFGPQEHGLNRVRGKWLEWEGIPVMPTWHPVYLLRQPSAKRETWKDIQEVMVRLERRVPTWMQEG